MRMRSDVGEVVIAYYAATFMRPIQPGLTHAHGVQVQVPHCICTTYVDLTYSLAHKLHWTGVRNYTNRILVQISLNLRGNQHTTSTKHFLSSENKNLRVTTTIST